jgi:glyceraldehyde-3-phosphate dehydrogenase (NADP+)
MIRKQEESFSRRSDTRSKHRGPAAEKVRFWKSTGLLMSRRYLRMRDWKLFIGGDWADGSGTRKLESPYNSETIAEVHTADESVMGSAIESTAAAFEKTRGLSSKERADILSFVSSRISERSDELSKTLAMESGKPISEAKTEIARSVFTFQYAAEEAKRIWGDLIPLDLIETSRKRWGISRRFPIGPVAGISPFNFPMNLVAHKVAPAIASGNPILIKPSSQTPLTALSLAEIVSESGAPAGTLNVVPCSPDVAERLATDDRFKMLSFTGSPVIGWRLKELASSKKVVLELGGNACAIVHDDADVELAVTRCLTGAFANAGQICISIQRILVQRDAFEDFIDVFVPRAKKLTLGDPLDPNTRVGPMINEKEAARAEQWLSEAVQGGAQVLCGGKRDGTLFEPTVLTDVDPAMKISCKEVFAPIVTVAPYDSFETALDIANDSEYGLQAGVFTQDIGRMWKAFETLEVGGVIGNDIPTYRVDHMPYGGVKQSGFGREGLRYAIEEMTEIKLLALNLN